MSVSRHKQNLADIRHRERWGPRLRELKKGSVIKREGRLDLEERVRAQEEGGGRRLEAADAT